ncbi:hypothetical protein SRHO_G00277160 [Serrasalmus rhombeus]
MSVPEIQRNCRAAVRGVHIPPTTSSPRPIANQPAAQAFWELYFCEDRFTGSQRALKLHFPAYLGVPHGRQLFTNISTAEETEKHIPTAGGSLSSISSTNTELRPTAEQLSPTGLSKRSGDINKPNTHRSQEQSRTAITHRGEVLLYPTLHDHRSINPTVKLIYKLFHLWTTRCQQIDIFIQPTASQTKTIPSSSR